MKAAPVTFLSVASPATLGGWRSVVVQDDGFVPVAPDAVGPTRRAAEGAALATARRVRAEGWEALRELCEPATTPAHAWALWQLVGADRYAPLVPGLYMGALLGARSSALLPPADATPAQLRALRAVSGYVYAVSRSYNLRADSQLRRWQEEQVGRAFVAWGDL